MAVLWRQPWCAATALLVPLLTLASPGWLKLAGVPPAWAVLWLLPWSLVEGRLSGALAGLALGLLLDSLHHGIVSQIPALVLLGWWWGRLGRQGPPIRRSPSLALLALLGTLVLDLSLMLQWTLLSWHRAGEALVPLLGAAAGGANGPLLGAGGSPALLAVPGWHWEDLRGAGLHILFGQTLLTALLAPMLCSLQLLLWRQLTTGGRG
jgi:hypothetical protein